MVATEKMNFLTLVSYSFLQTLLARMHRFATIQNVTDRRRQTDRRNSVPKARPIVRSAKNTYRIYKLTLLMVNLVNMLVFHGGNAC